MMTVPRWLTWMLLATTLEAQTLVPTSAGLESFFPQGDFGIGATFDGEDLIVGAPNEPGGGAFYVFRRSGADWVQVQRVQSPDPNFSFAYELTVESDTLAVSHPLTPVVYTYERVAGIGWVFEDTLQPLGASGEGIGGVDLDGGVLVLSAVSGPISGFNGIVTYERTGGAWLEVDRFPITSFEVLGGVHIDQDDLIVELGGVLFPGALNAHTRAGAGWSSAAQIARPDGLSWGTPQVALDGTTLVVEDTQIAPVPSLLVYAKSPGQSWLFDSNLTPAGNEKVLTSVDLRGDRLVAETSFGVAYYERVFGNWLRTATLDPDGDQISFVALGDDELAAGLPNEARVAVFHTRLSETYCVAKSSSIGCTGSVSMLPVSSPVSQGGTHALSVAGIDGRRLSVPFASATGRIELPFNGGTLCVAPPLSRGTPLWTGGTEGACNGALAMPANDATTAFDFGSGSTSWVQVWYRDANDPFGVGLTNAIEIAYY